MKSLLIVLVMLTVGLWTMPVSAAPGDVEYVDQIFTISPLGDGTIVVKHRFDAQTYIAWKNKYGSNISLLKRDWSKMLSSYDISDFDVKQSDMDRVVTITIGARGCVTTRGNGLCELEFPKNFRMGDKVGNTYSFNTSSKLDTGQVLQMSTRVVLPPEATDIKDSTNEVGNPLITYQIPIAAVMNARNSEKVVVKVEQAGLWGVNFWVWLGAGFVLAVVGFIFCIVSFFFRKRKVAAGGVI